MKTNKKSKVLSAQPRGDWQNKNGETFYRFEIVMENGDVGEYSSINEEQNKFIINQETEYEFDTSYDKYPKIRPIYKKKSFDISDEAMRRSVALKSSCSLHAGKIISEIDVLKSADIFYHYIKTGEIPEFKPLANQSINESPF